MTQCIKKSYAALPETCVVDKSVHGLLSPTGVCRANVCHRDMFYLTLLRVFCIHKS